MLSFPSSLAACCGFVLIGLASPASGALYHVVGNNEILTHDNGTNSTWHLDSYNRTDPLSASDAVSNVLDSNGGVPGNIAHTELFTSASAGLGAAHARTYAGFQRNFPFSPPGSADFTIARANAGAEVTLGDVLIAGPAGDVTTSYNMHLGGLLQVSGDPDINGSPNPRLSGLSVVSIQFFVNGNQVGEGRREIYSNITGLGSGLLANYAGGDIAVTTDPFTVATNTPFTVTFTLGLQSSGLLYYDDSGNATALADFSSTLSFTTDGPVFNLAAGYTADSPSGGLVANRFLVPEPGSLAMIGLGGLGMLRRRRA